jgi:imidazolonepropionase-like amidohydrolase
MGRALSGEIPVVFHAETLDQIQAVLDFVDAHGLKRVMLAGGDDAPAVARTLRERGIGVICGPTHALPRRMHEPYDAPFTLASRLYQAGVDYCISDGAGSAGGDNNSAMNTRNLPYMAAVASAYGLPKAEALRAITLHPARMLGAGDLLGSIEVGKIADLIVTDGDLLEITTKVEQVYIAGREIPMTSRHTRFFEKYDSRPRGENARPRAGAASQASR